MTPQQSKLARAVINMTIKEVAEAVELSPTTIQMFETEKSDLRLATYTKLRDFYLYKGVTFPDNSGVSSEPSIELTSAYGSYSIFEETFLTKVDAWRSKQPHQPDRLQALHELVEIGLKSETSLKGPQKNRLKKKPV